MPIPTIIAQPANVTAAAGSTIILQVGANGGALSYQWIKLGNYYQGNVTLANGGRFAGVNSASLTISNLSTGQVGMYGCAVSNQDGQVSTRVVAVLLDGMVLPKINGQPAATTVAAGAQAHFSVVVGSPAGDPATCQWLKNGATLGDGIGGVSGAHSANLTLGGVTLSEADYYQCRVANSSGTVLSNPAGLTVTSGGTTHAPQGFPPLAGVLSVTPPVPIDVPPPVLAGGYGGYGGTAGIGGAWTFIGTTSQGTAESLRIANVRRTRQSQAAGTLTFTRTADFDAAPLFVYGEWVTVVHGGAVFFQGTVTQTPSSGGSQGESQSYTLSDPWWHLTRLVAHQVWKVNAGGQSSTKLSGRIILGQAVDGTRQTTGQSIAALLEYARTSGAPLQIGTIDPDLFAPLDEVKDVTVANAIATVLRWHPDCVTWFDHAASPPALHIRRAANLPTLGLTIGVPPLSAVGEITARVDLRVPAVVIHYEKTGSSNGTPTFDLVNDAYPEGATGTELNALCVTIPLRGASSTSVEQRIETIGIRDDLGADGSAEIVQFLLNAGCDALQNLLDADPDITPAGVTITACSRGLANPAAHAYDQTTGQMTPEGYDGSLDRMLVNGGITDWMIRSLNVQTQEQKLTFSFTTDSGTGGGSGDIQTYKDWTFGFRALNAGNNSDTVASTRFATLTNFDAGDAVPTGLAASCFAAFNRLHYSGSVTLVEAEPGGAAGIGQALNLLGGTGAFAAMNAMITSETVDVDSGTTQLTFGPPEHLGPSELAELLKLGNPRAFGRTAGSPAGIHTGTSQVRTGSV